MSIRVGVSLRSRHGVGDPRLGVRWMVEQARTARLARLDHLFVGDHHVTGPHPYYQNTPILARLLAEWGEAPAGALYLLALHNPVLVAEHVGTLASIAAGPFVMQCAVGGDSRQFGGMGADHGARGARFEAALRVVLALLRGEEVSTEAPSAIHRARIAPLPPDPVEVWVGGHADAAVDRAARLGDGWIAGPEATDVEAARLVSLYRSRCSAHDRQPAAVVIRRDVHVGGDDAAALAVAAPVLERGYRAFDPAACVVGGPERVAARLATYAEMGYTDVLVRPLADAQSDAVACLEAAGAVRDLLAER